MNKDTRNLIWFIKEYNIEYNEYKDELLLFIEYSVLDEFTNIVWEGFFDEEWYEVTIKFWYIVVDIIPICEYLDIDTKDILKALNSLSINK